MTYVAGRVLSTYHHMQSTYIAGKSYMRKGVYVEPDDGLTGHTVRLSLPLPVGL